MTGNGFEGALRAARTHRKLSQLELAVRANTSQRHVSFLEQGRSAPGRDIVIRLAEALDLPLRQRNDLLLAAGFAPVYPRTSLDDPTLEPVVGALGEILRGYLPFPALIIDRYGELVAANAAVAVLLDGIPPWLLTPPVNVYRLALHPDGIAPRIGNLVEWRARIIARLSRELRTNPDTALDTLLAELRAGNDSAGTTQPASSDLGLAVPLRVDSAHGELRLITTIATFSDACDITLAELKIEAFLPADEHTASTLGQLNAHRRASNISFLASAQFPAGSCDSR